MDNSINKFWLDRDQALLVVVDVQEKLVPTMENKVYRRVENRLHLLLETAAQLHLPVVATEQYPKGLGKTVPELQAACASGAVEKVSFGCCGEPSFLERIKQFGRSQVIVTGMEAHVCVYQTVLGLLEAGFHVHLVRDAICSRNKIDFLNSLELARDAGAVVTTAETAAFQLLREAGSPEFKAVSKLIKN